MKENIFRFPSYIIGEKTRTAYMCNKLITADTLSWVRFTSLGIGCMFSRTWLWSHVAAVASFPTIQTCFMSYCILDLLHVFPRLAQVSQLIVLFKISNEAVTKNLVPLVICGILCLL